MELSRMRRCAKFCQLSVSLGRCRRRTNRRGWLRGVARFCRQLSVSLGRRLRRTSRRGGCAKLRDLAPSGALRSLDARLDDHIATDLREGLISNSRDFPRECSLKPVTRSQRRDTPAVGRTNVRQIGRSVACSDASSCFLPSSPDRR